MNANDHSAHWSAVTPMNELLGRLQSVLFRARTQRTFQLSTVHLAVLLLLSLPCLAGAEPTRDFVSGRLAEIEQTRSGRSFVLILWSLDCPPCLHELGFLATHLDKYPETNIVLVSTDDASLRPQVDAMLAKNRLSSRVESWIFAEASAQNLRYQVDPDWYGEMPRSYFYDAAHHRSPLSGAVTEKHFDVLKSISRKP